MPTANEWAQQQWGNAELGDKRRTHRAVALGLKSLIGRPRGCPDRHNAGRT
jgi:hypothetical protein